MELLNFMSGGIMMASAACGLFFLKSWKTSDDRLFLHFALAFWALSLERWMLTIVSAENEARYYVYTFRLVAFSLILLAIVDKNRKSAP